MALALVQNLVFDYPTKRALHGVGFSVAPGEIVALVGPNGAGKTTLMRCLAALDEPYSGRVEIAGCDTAAEPRAVHELVGFLPDFFGLYDALSARDCLIHAARMRGLARPAAESAADRAAERVGLGPRLRQKAGELSRGWRQRLGVGQAIVHDPKLLILDEPASGLDPEARGALSILLRSLRDQGMTLIVSSHILAELEEYSTHMLAIRDGRLAADVPTVAAARLAPRLTLELAAPFPSLAALLGSLPGVVELESSPIAARFRFNGDAAARAALVRRLVESGAQVAGLNVAQAKLEDIYREQVMGAA